jgi:hypothetical protein
MDGRERLESYLRENGVGFERLAFPTIGDIAVARSV